jgi:hypothetical protein
MIKIADDYGKYLSSRFIARKIREQISGPIEFDFTDVTLAHSFADELFAVLVQEKGEDWFAKNIKIIGLSQDSKYQILHAIILRNIMTE